MFQFERITHKDETNITPLPFFPTALNTFFLTAPCYIFILGTAYYILPVIYSFLQW